jgi:hypothetical protein
VEGNQEVETGDFALTVTSGPNSPAVAGLPHPDCIEDPVLVPGEVVVGEYTLTEELQTDDPEPDSIEVEGDCEQDPSNPQRATGEIEVGETQECRFVNSPGAS